MDIFLKASASILVMLILYLSVSKYNKDFSALLSIACCCVILFAAISYMKPIIEFIHKLKNLGNFDSDFMRIILKAVGIGMITEITVMICSDSGNASLGKSLQILSSAVILWISLPVLNQLIDLLDQILGAI